MFIEGTGVVRLATTVPITQCIYYDCKSTSEIGRGTCSACCVLAISQITEFVTTYGRERDSYAVQGLPLANHLHLATQWQCFAVAAVYGESVSLAPLHKQCQSPAVADGLVQGAKKQFSLDNPYTSVDKQYVLVTECNRLRQVAHNMKRS